MLNLLHGAREFFSTHHFKFWIPSAESPSVSISLMNFGFLRSGSHTEDFFDNNNKKKTSKVNEFHKIILNEWDRARAWTQAMR